MVWNSVKFAGENQDKIVQLIKQELLSSPVVLKLFKHFEIDPGHLDTLQIDIQTLHDKYAETDSKRMTLNAEMFQGGWDNFKHNYFFVVCHEIVHWLTRCAEDRAYFNDPEETLGFVSSIAYEISQKTHPDEIYNKILPKVTWHFNDEVTARDFFANMVEKAQKLLSE
jgi:hypothetical protein